jgi:sn-glycerol 3-phosphate transport system substrate-binding protein
MTAATLMIAMPAMLVFACSGGNGGSSTVSSDCPIGLVEKSDKPVQITFWHAMNTANRDTLERMVGEFNASHPKIQVQAVYQGTYDENLAKYFTALRGGDLPDLIQIEDTGTQRMIDSGSVARAQDCIDAEHYDLSDFVDRVIAFYSVGGKLWPYPFNVSNPVLYYNKTAFAKAGLDPEKPPATLDEVRQDAQKIVDSGVARHGIAVEESPWYYEQWLAKAGQPFLDNDNGRAARATSVLLDGDSARSIFEWLGSMVSSGLAMNVGRNTSGADAFLTIGSGDAAMSMGTSAGLRSVFGVLESGQFPDVKLGVGPMPGLTAPDAGGISVGGASLFVVNKSSPVEQEATRIFAEWLNEPAQQAEWHIGSGYIPTRKSSATDPRVQQLWAESPQFRVAFDQLQSGQTSIASSGSVLGAYKDVREAIVKGMEEMWLQGKDPDAALADAAKAADDAIKQYNDRIGQ